MGHSQFVCYHWDVSSNPGISLSTLPRCETQAQVLRGGMAVPVSVSHRWTVRRKVSFHFGCRSIRHRRSLAVAAFWGWNKTTEPEQVISDKRRLLLSYVQGVEPTVVKRFIEIASPQVVDTMVRSVNNLVGTLPPQFFTVQVTAHGENLAQLMLTMMMTGYLLRNLQYRLELTQSLMRQSAAESASGSSLFPLDTSEFAPGTQKRVSGEVIRWNVHKGPEAIPAKQYIQSLEEELRQLRLQVAQQDALAKQLYEPGTRNHLYEYLQSLDSITIQELTAGADDDTLEAMNSFIHRVLGTENQVELLRMNSQSDASELSSMLYYLAVVGYLLRALEVRFYLENFADLGNLSDDDSLPELLAGGF